MTLTDPPLSDIEAKHPSRAAGFDDDRQGARTCVAPVPRGEAARVSSTTPAQLFSRWLDFIHITDSANGQAVSCRLTLLGVIDDTCLMVTSTTLERDWLAMQPGRRLNATVFDGRRVYTFDTTVTSRFATPFRYLHLSYPVNLGERPPRRTSRAAVSISAVLTHEVELDQASSHEPTHESVHETHKPVCGSTRATITNLSAMSAGLHTSDVRLSVGAPVRLSFTLHAQEGDAMPISVSAIVRREEIDIPSVSATYGVEFTDVPNAVRAYLETYVALSATP
jgi:hypothetical protein